MPQHITMGKFIFLEGHQFFLSIVFFAVLSPLLMLAYIVSFKRKDDSLLPG